MSHNVTLRVTSALAVLLLTLHLAGDVVYGMDAGGSSLLVGILILAVWLYGTLALGQQRSGHIIMLLGAIFASAMPVIHTRGAGLGGEFARSDGAFLFIWALLALGVTGLVAFVLSLKGLRALRRARQTMNESSGARPDHA
jgi:hypothetical protein